MLVSEEHGVGQERASRVGRAWPMFAAAFAVRLAAALAAGALRSPLNNYNAYAITAGDQLIRPTPGLFPPGDFYAAWLLFHLGGETLAGFGLVCVVLGSLVPLFVVRTGPALFPSMNAQHAQLAGWLAVCFPPLILLSATWRYMLPAVLLGFWSLDAVSRRRPAEILLAGTALLFTRPDYWLGTAAALLLLDWAPFKKGLMLAVPVALLAVHNLVMPAALTGPHNLWYNLDAGTNARTRTAVLGHGTAEWQPEYTLLGSSNESQHREHVLAFIRHHPGQWLELLIMKAARVVDVHRDGAQMKGPFGNAVYTAALLALLLTALPGLGKMGARQAIPGLAVILAYIVPMVLVFSLDRTRVLLQSLWLMPAAFWLRGVLPSPIRSWLHEA